MRLSRYSILFFLLALIQSAFAVDISAKIKASYIYNFLQFITFPDSSLQSHSQLNICVVGKNSLGNSLDKIEGESTPQAKLHVVYLDNISNSNLLKSCNVIYCTRSIKNDTQQLLNTIDKKEVVTIAEYSPFITEGGLIELFNENSKILFHINTSLVTQTHFKVAPQLIQIGRN